MPLKDAIEPYPHAVKAKHIEDGIVKFPTNIPRSASSAAA